MNLKDVVYGFLKNQENITNVLARYDNEPAIFFNHVPEDADSGWNDQKAYPRIELLIDMRSSTNGKCTIPQLEKLCEHMGGLKSTRVLQVAIFCENTGILPEEIERLVRNAFQDALLQPENEACVSMEWFRTEPYQLHDRGTATKTIGCEVCFDILEYPCQFTTEPDPVMACVSFMRERHPECKNINYDTIDRYFQAGIKTPAFYFRLAKLKRNSETNTVVWMDAILAVHVFASTQGARWQWLTEFATAALLAGEIPMLDGSPMQVAGIEVNQGTECQTQGQMTLSVRYGMLRYLEEPRKVMSLKGSIKQ